MADGVDEDDGDDNYTLSTAVTYVEQYGLSAFRVTLTDKTPKLSSEALEPVRTTRRATVDELCDWFGGEPDQQGYGIGIYAGAVSGNLLIADFDRADIHDAFLRRCAEQGVGHLAARMPHVKTRKGDHRYFRCGNYPYSKMVLARYWDEAEQKKRTLIEVQGTGVYAVAPSRLPGMPPAPDCPYRVVSGSLGDIPVFSADEVDALLDIMRGLTEVQPDPKPEPPLPPSPGWGNRPGDDYSARGDHRALLETHGWQYLSTRPDGTEYWRRPGKTEGSCSATYNTALGLFYVFSSNADPFEEGQAYKLFAVYALLKHGGDYSAAAKALRDDGYGASDWGDPDEVWVSEDELARIYTAADAAKAKGKAAAVYEIADDLAKLPVGEYEDILHDLDKAIDALHKRDLDSKVRKVRKHLLVKQRKQAEETLTTTKPRVVVNENIPLREIAYTAVHHLIAGMTSKEWGPTLFQHDLALVELVVDPEGNARLQENGRHTPQTRLEEICDMVEVTDGHVKHVECPKKLSDHIQGRWNWPLQPIQGISISPFIRKDGSIMAEPGYDAQTRRIYRPVPGFVLPPISENPGTKELERAVKLLHDPVCDFIFASKADYANFIAARFAPMLLPYVDEAFPFILIEANAPDSGKGLLARVLVAEELGQEPDVTTTPATDEEWRKQISSTLKSGVPISLYDNIDGVLKSQHLAALLTARRWRARVRSITGHFRAESHGVDWHRQ